MGMGGMNNRRQTVLILRSATIATYTLLFLLLVVVVSCNAFCTIQKVTLASSDEYSMVQQRIDKRSMLFGIGGSTTTTTTSRLYMAAPGFKSEAQRKMERDNEIRAKIAMLKREGKMNKKKDPETGIEESQEDSTIKEAEAFFNKPSPLKKFAARKAERERKEKEEEEQAGK